jgi:hypothetical protein
VDPWPQGGVEEFLPLIPDVEHEGLAKEEVFESEAGSNSPEIKEIPADVKESGIKSDRDSKQLHLEQ